MAPDRGRHGGDLSVWKASPITYFYLKYISIRVVAHYQHRKRFFFPISFRALLVYCLKHYKGDDKIKSFIWDLISPTKEGQDQALLNHSGEH